MDKVLHRARNCDRIDIRTFGGVILQEKKPKFRLYDWLNRDGKGVAPEDVISSAGLKGFFYRYKISFSKLLSINIIYVIGNVFLLFLILTLAGYTKTTYFHPANDSSALYTGIMTALGGGNNAVELSYLTLNWQQIMSSANTTLTYLFWGLSCITLLTWGCVNTGCAYLIRNLVMGEPVFPLSDFWYSVKRNWKQAIPLGILDAVISFIIPYNIYAMLVSGGNYFSSLMLWMNIVLFFLYNFMRFYLYVELVSFDLSIRKIFKNAFIFSLIGWKRNFVALLGIVLMLLLEYIFLLFGGGVLLPLAVAFPLMMFFSHASFMAIFASFAVIKKYMIDDSPASELSENIE